MLDASTRNSVNATPEEVPKTTGSYAPNEMLLAALICSPAANGRELPSTTKAVNGGVLSLITPNMPNNDAMRVTGPVILWFSLSFI